MAAGVRVARAVSQRMDARQGDVSRRFAGLVHAGERGRLGAHCRRTGAPGRGPRRVRRGGAGVHASAAGGRGVSAHGRDGRPAGRQRLAGGAERKRRKKRRARQQRAGPTGKTVDCADAARAGRCPSAAVDVNGVLLTIVPTSLKG
jgi:hypothetical protein